ncbi:hypothetical protein F5890DRAFT_1478568 [Lentinula detonsa]|uniref:Uncharacterized protein n=1 Tax=Lentinula detonsa TaxID=2804962 RepID=A0AA38PPL6_9AGAR|nr:hypothetical protein F5890DRAFT_1478568 [Lentinula detonsa]
MSFSASTNNAQAPYSSPTSALGKNVTERNPTEMIHPLRGRRQRTQRRIALIIYRLNPLPLLQANPPPIWLEMLTTPQLILSQTLSIDLHSTLPPLLPVARSTMFFEKIWRRLQGVWPDSKCPNAPQWRLCLTLRLSKFSFSTGKKKLIRTFSFRVLANSSPQSLLERTFLQVNPQSEAVRQNFLQLRNLTQALPGGSIGSKIATISENQVRLIFARVSSVGLNSWTPDFLGSVSSLWNELHESIALDTFRQACMNRAYETFGVEMKFVLNSELAIGLYRNFVFHHLLNNICKEQKNPGAIQKELDLSKVYKHRKHRAEERLKYLEMLKWNPRISTILSSPSCHSDDEDSPDKKEFFRLLLPLRNPKVTVFVEHLDDYRNKTRAYDHCCNAYKEIPWVPHPLGKISSFAHKLPKPVDPDKDDDADKEKPDIALDWFDPVQFNELPPHIRFRYRNCPIALPPAQFTGGTDWQKMKNKHFMKKYGNSVKSLYKIPTKEEINGVNDDGEETDWEGDSSVETDDEEEDDENAEAEAEAMQE